MAHNATNLMDQPKRIRHHHREMPRRIRALLAEAEAWCAQERGRRAQLALYLDVWPSSVSAWFRECKKAHPAKQPTGEQVLAIQEFLKDQRQK
jgi:hypothetical protein